MRFIAAMDRATHLKGLLLTFIAVLILSPDALLVRLVRCDVWTLLFWRCLLTSIMQAIFLAIFFRRQFLQSFRNIGRAGLLSASTVAIGALFFIHSLKQTTAANTLIILASAPVFSSLLTFFILREPIARRTWIAIFICFGGILLIFAGSLGQGLLLGDLLALGATFMWASNIVTLRSGRANNMVPANLLGNLLVVPAALLGGAQPLAVSAPDVLFLVLLGGFVLPVSFTMITISPRFLPAPEVSLILLIETIVGPVWVWLVLGEVPLATTLIAGLLIVGTLTAHTLLSLWASRRPGAARSPLQPSQ